MQPELSAAAFPGMAAQRPLLTLAVPTYNRAAHLDLLLTHLAPQLAASSEVELLISDNASSDDTAATVERFMAAGLRCRYLRNAANLDADRNFLRCYEQAAGRFVWIFGDDDVLFPGSLAYVLALLDHNSQGDGPDAGPDLVYLAPFGFRGQPNERHLANPRPGAYAFIDPAAFVHAVGLRGDLIMISAVIVNKDTVEHEPHPEFREGFGTQLLQLGWTFTALSRLRRGVVVESGLYAVCEADPKRLFDLARVFGVNWAAAADRYLAPGTRLHRAVLRDQLYSWFVTNWYGMRRNPGHTILRDPVGQMRPVYGGFALFWLCVWPLLAWPMPLAGCWLALWRGIRYADRALNRARHRKLHRSAL
jgi:abequosyltransferase